MRHPVVPTWSTALVLALLLVPVLAEPSVAQDIQLASRAPRFLLEPAPSAEPRVVDANSIPILKRRINVDLRGATLEAALTEISRQAGLGLMYSKAVVPLGSRVQLQAGNITVAAALTEVLLESGVDVLITATGQAVITRRVGAEQQRQRVQRGVVTGRVTDAKTGDELAGADVHLEDTRLRASTGVDGRYRIAEIEPGNYTLVVRRIGYARRTQPVTVVEGEAVTVDVTLTPVPTQLDEVVTTVTGEQRLRELGHVVGRINADSVVKAAPISSLSELLTGRVPGLQVFTHSGLVGGRVSLQARTPNSIFLGNEPILIVDGIRHANDITGRTGPFGPEETSRLNDLNPNDIESIEVVKGPSAATLYGTDAANGVIVITTKRGRSGVTQWNAYMRAAVNEVPRFRYPDAHWGWGTVFGTPNSPFVSCTLARLASGQCTQQDSVGVLPSPLNDPELTIFHSKPGWEYGLNVSGGRQDVRYYFAADLEQATGPIQMPAAAIDRLTALRGLDELPEEQLEPNTQRQMSLRGNVTLALSPTAELQFNSGYGHTSARTVASSYAGLLFPRPGQPYGSQDPAQGFSRTSTEGTDRFSGSVTGQWQPRTWLQGRATLGLDLGNSDRYSIARPGESEVSLIGNVEEDRTRRVGITGDAGLSTHARLGRLSFRTALGAQYTRQKTNVLVSGGVGLPPGGESVREAAFKYIDQYYTETATLGSYLEETIGLNDRLFVTGALRVDGGTNFGRDYDAVVYPKTGVSWLLSEEPFLPRVPGLDELRLRYAYGASGQQPLSYMTRPDYGTRNTLVDGVTSTGIVAGSVGNPDLKPERVREHEGGFDATGFNGRIQLGLTWFTRTTVDQLVSRPASLGFGTVFRNLGRVRARGFEADLTVRPIETPLVSWQVQFQHAIRRNTVEDLGGVTPSQNHIGSYVEGYPLGARFATEILGWNDANGDGILVPAEMQMSTDLVYQGEGTPPRTQTLVTSVGLFEQRVRLSAVVQRQSGYTQVNELGCRACRAAVDPSTPLEAQALVVAPSASFNYSNIEPADHTRLQEVTVAVDIPGLLLRAVGLRAGSVALSGRNLALWTSFSGPDPASSAVTSYWGGTASNIPQSRTWVFRLDLGL